MSTLPQHCWRVLSAPFQAAEKTRLCSTSLSREVGSQVGQLSICGFLKGAEGGGGGVQAAEEGGRARAALAWPAEPGETFLPPQIWDPVIFGQLPAGGASGAARPVGPNRSGFHLPPACGWS